MHLNKKLSKVVPGERLSTTEEYQPGQNVYVHEGQIFASIVGQKSIINNTLNVTANKKIYVPSVGSLALFRVHRVKLNQINGNIIMVVDEADKYLKSLPASELRGERVIVKIKEIEKTQPCTGWPVQ